jgi:hypothetical protein
MFASQKRASRSSVAIELYQQTRKGERLVGDLLTSIGGKSIIIEFKRDKSELSEELKKASKTKLRRELAADEDARFLEISKRCHYISIALKYSDTNEDCLAFLPYMDLITQEPKLRQWQGDPDFCKRYIDPDSFECGVSPDDFKYYIDKLALISGGTCGGLAITIDKDGIKSSVVFEDVRELQVGLAEAERKAEQEIQRHEPSRSSPGLER